MLDRRFIPDRIARTCQDLEKPIPTQMRCFLAQEGTAFIADHREVNRFTTEIIQQISNAGQRGQVTDMDAAEMLVKQLFRPGPILTEQNRKTISKRGTGPDFNFRARPD